MTVADRKFDPRLRMCANGNFKVNRIRAEHWASVGVPQDKNVKKEILRGEEAVTVTLADLPGKEERGFQKKVTEDIYVNVFIQIAPTSSGTIDKLLPGEISRKGDLVTAQIKLSQLEEFQKDDSVLYVEMGQHLSVPHPVIESNNVEKSNAVERQIEFPPELDPEGGNGVLIGIIDVAGFDFSHPDFLDKNGETRFIRIWDQGASKGKTPANFHFGREITREEMNAAIERAKKINIQPYQVERQSHLSIGSHGTHVASIAAGNNGVCYQAILAGVLIDLTEGDMDRRKSFYDSTRVAHAADYLLHLAKELGNVPISINISMGTNGHAHDGSCAISRWIDRELTVPGRSICVAAGNAGQEVPEEEGDIGFIMGRIHTSGQIPASGLSKDIEWVVVGNIIADLSENELEIWYSSQNRFSISVKPPDMDWIGPIKSGQFVENRQLADGSFVSIYNELYHPANGNNFISVFLSSFLTDSGIVGIPAGTWKVRLHGDEIRDGKYHGWIERDDPRRLGKIGPQKETWNFPSFFSETSNVDNTSISALAFGNNVIAVANLDMIAGKINISSSQGPTRDGKLKPEVVAPGTRIDAAKGFAGTNDF